MMEQRLDLRICSSKFMSPEACLWPLPQFLRNTCETQRNAGKGGGEIQLADTGN